MALKKVGPSAALRAAVMVGWKEDAKAVSTADLSVEEMARPLVGLMVGSMVDSMGKSMAALRASCSVA